MTSYRLGLVGRGIDLSLAPAFHRLAGERLGLDLGCRCVHHTFARQGQTAPQLVLPF